QGPQGRRACRAARTLRAAGRVEIRGPKTRRALRAAGDLGRQRAGSDGLSRAVRPRRDNACESARPAHPMNEIGDALAFLLLPFAASVAFVLIHAYLGVHVLRRNIVFADLALAQLSALGASVAFALGYSPTSPAGFAYALAFTALG